MELTESFHDKIADICLKCFKTLPKSGRPNSEQWTILSCIVMEFHNELNVVALGTGSKCIGKTKLSSLGDILNDSHAEIMCRRAFLKYIFHQIKDSGPIFTYNSQTNKYVANVDARFHFFTTHIPCGDAAIFPKHNFENIGQVVHTNDYNVPCKIAKIDLDIYRTGAKCLTGDENQDLKCPGLEYHIVGVVRTKPGRGDPTLSVSCSDKLSKWCHLGIQGALLSLLLEEPIYICSFTILSTSPFCPNALDRALYNRLGPVDLEKPFSRHHLVVGSSSHIFEFSRDSKKRPCPSSIAWCNVKEKSFEVAVEGKRQGVTKKKLNTELGRLQICKVELLKLFKNICNSKGLLANYNIESMNYIDIKKLAINYQQSWNVLRKSFKTWISKDENLLNFV